MPNVSKYNVGRVRSDSLIPALRILALSLLAIAFAIPAFAEDPTWAVDPGSSYKEPAACSLPIWRRPGRDEDCSKRDAQWRRNICAAAAQPEANFTDKANSKVWHCDKLPRFLPETPADSARRNPAPKCSDLPPWVKVYSDNTFQEPLHDGTFNMNPKRERCRADTVKRHVVTGTAIECIDWKAAHNLVDFDRFKCAQRHGL